jgi:alanine racemase
VLTIDFDAVAANYRTLKAHAASAVCGAVVKSDGYGLGLAPVARALAAAGCDTFFITNVDEGITLRQALADRAPTARVFVLSGLVSGAESVFDAHDLIPVLSTIEQIDLWAAHGRSGGARPAALKIDSGMTRLGLTASDVETVAASPDRLDGVILELVMSHLACAAQPDNPLNAAQLAAFETARARFPDAPASLANSAGIMLGAEYHFDLVRPGAALFGVATVQGRPNTMMPVVTLQGKILQLRHVDSETPVGYGATRRVPAGRLLATVAVGYGDGYPRALGNRGAGYVDNFRVPIVGRVSMDLVIFDVTDVPESRLRASGFIDLIGPHYGVDDLAAAADTIGYEILTRLGRRFRRIHVGGDC